MVQLILTKEELDRRESSDDYKGVVKPRSPDRFYYVPPEKPAEPPQEKAAP